MILSKEEIEKAIDKSKIKSDMYEILFGKKRPNSKTLSNLKNRLTEILGEDFDKVYRDRKFFC